MAKFSQMSGTAAGVVQYVFHCPACGCGHWVRTQGPEPCWQFNGDLERPTITPSLRVRGQIVCHSFIRDGRIQFLDDCTHELAGQTVDIPNWEKW